MEDYKAFLESKTQSKNMYGFKPESLPDCLFPFQEELVDWSLQKGRAAIFADCGMGKGQPPDSKVLTANGWQKIGNLKIGDEVCASDGRFYNLTGIYPRGRQDTYRVYFSDGSSYVVDSEHIHIVRTNNDRQRGKKWRNMNTRELIECGNLRYGKDGKSRNYDIPVVAPIAFTDIQLYITPYVMGVLLGDGYICGNVSISSDDEQIIQRFADELPEGVKLAKQKHSKYDYSVITGLCGTKRHPFRKALCDMGLMGKKSHNKFIPQKYLLSSTSDRIDLLRGLMDTDGYIDPNCGCCQFYSVSKRLATGVLELVRSLGGIPTFSKKAGMLNGIRMRDCYMVTFSLKTFNPFYLERKAESWNQEPRDNGRWIDRIEFENVQETTCISVGSPDHSYVTENYIVTHNTPMQLVWADKINRETNIPVLILTPLAVSHQTKAEGEKFGIETNLTRDGSIVNGINITNYERLHYYNAADFAGVVCDESSAIKAFDGKRRKQVTRFMSKAHYRLLCSATPSPNDHVELGTSSEALGELSQSEMISMFFKSSDNARHSLFKEGDFWNRQKWFFKAHSELPFWRWVCTWARALQKPSDLGNYNDDGFILPPLNIEQHTVKHNKLLPGEMFPIIATTLREQRIERKMTMEERCDKVADLVDHDNPVVVWCQYNAEGDYLEKNIPGAVQVAGCNSDDEKEERLKGFSNGDIRVLVTKPKIGAWGLNWQHCGQHVFFPSHSFEQYYQAVRRSWRFGRTEPVKVDIVTTIGEAGVTDNLKKKQIKADELFNNLIREMNHATRVSVGLQNTKETELPKW